MNHKCVTKLSRSISTGLLLALSLSCSYANEQLTSEEAEYEELSSLEQKTTNSGRSEEVWPPDHWVCQFIDCGDGSPPPLMAPDADIDVE